MVREISGRLLSDKLLKDYSYCGRKRIDRQEKKPLNVYSNIIKLIIDSTSKNFPEVPRQNILDYFKKEYVKQAKKREDRKNIVS